MSLEASPVESLPHRCKKYLESAGDFSCQAALERTQTCRDVATPLAQEGPGYLN